MDKPKMKLIGEDGNAFAILGRASAAAKKAGWGKDRISAFTKEAMAGDYNHLLRTVMENFDADGGTDEEDEAYAECEWCGEIGCDGSCEDEEICQLCGDEYCDGSCDDDDEDED